MAHEPDGVIDFGATPFSNVAASGDVNIDGVLQGVKWTNADLTYSFPSVAADYDDGAYPDYANLSAGFSDITAKQIVAFDYWFGNYEAVSGLTFTELDGAPGDQDEDQEATLRYANSTNAGGAFGKFPGNQPFNGDAWFDTEGDDPDLGEKDWLVIGHEMGHTLGLKHGHIKGPIAGPMAPDRDCREFSIMTYREYIGASTAQGSGYTIKNGHNPQSLMMYDIAAIQHMYGANFGSNSGNSVYTFSTSTGAMSINGVQTVEGAAISNIIFRTIWDGNGTDTYDFSAYTRNLAIDLRPGFWTDLDVGGTKQRADLDTADTTGANPFGYARGHVCNALQYNGDARSLIENAVGGSGDDTLTGNDAWNTLDGGTGDDSYFGGIGNDTIIDEDGANTFDGGTGTDTLDLRAATAGWSVGLGNGVASYSGIFSTVVSIENVYGGSGNDVFIGNTLGNRLEGGDGDDSLYGGDGVDTFEDYFGGNAIFGGNDRDTLDLSGGGSRWTVDLVAGTFVKAGIVSTVSDVENVLGGSNDDTITGDDEDNTLYGGDGDDVMAGGLGANILYGGDGDDTLTSTLGLDELFGGNDEDTFVTGTFGVTIDGGGSDDTVFASTFVGTNDLDGGDATDTIDWSASFENGLTFDLAAGTVADAFGSDRMANFEHLTGTDGDDTITGTSAANTLDGGDGLDTIYGGAGNDILYAGAGNGGQENLYGGADVDILYGGTSLAEINYRGDAGNDLLYAGSSISGATDFYGGSEIDWAIFTALATGGTFTLGSAGTFVTGTKVIDLQDIEKLTGTTGDDTILGDDEDNYLSAAAGDDSVDGGTGDDTLYGGAGNDTLSDQSLGDSTIDGGADDDDITISASGSLYDIDGGTETDHLKVNSVGWTVDLVAGTLAADQGGGGTAAGTVAGIEDVTGSIGDDDITGDGAANSLEGSSGTDTLTGNAGTDTLNGNGGEDYLYGGSARDYFREEADGSFNIVSGGGGTDTLDVSNFTAGAIVDPSTLESGTTTLSLFGIEKLILTAKGDEVSGIFGDIVFGRGADILTLDLPAGVGALYDGGRGNDRVILAGNTGALLDLAAGTVDGTAALVAFENATGTAQDDTILGSGKSNVLQGADGADTVSGLGGADTLEGGTGGDELAGGGAADVLFGGNQGDTLLGDGGDDTLDGGSGADTLTGGAGTDSLTGGTGADVFVFAPGDSGVATGQDRITDFVSATDRIDLTAFGALDFVFGAGFGGTGTGEVRQQVGGGVSVLEIDADGDGNEEAEIILDGVAALLFDFDLILV